MKRLLGLFLSIIMLLSSFPYLKVSAADSAQNLSPVTGFGYEKKVTTAPPVLLMDFESYGYSADGGHGFDSINVKDYFPDKGDSGYGTYFSTSASRSFKALDQPLTSGVYLFSFDIKRTEATGNFYSRYTLSESTAESRDNTWETFAISGEKIGYYSNSRGFALGKSIPFQANKWYHVMMWMDFDSKTIYHYVDNELIGSTNLPYQANGLYFCVESSSATNITSLDNIAVFKSTVALNTELSGMGINVPQEVRGVLRSNISSAKQGNLFTDFQEVSLTVETANKIDETVDYSVRYDAKNHAGDIVWTQKKDGLRLGPGERVTEEIKPSVNQYDIYTLELTLTPVSSDLEPVTTDAEFSVVNSPPAGYSSPNFGSCIHISKNETQWDEVKDAVDNMGIGWLRDDFRWAWYETEKGKYGFQGTYQKLDPFVDEANSMGMKILAIWYPENPLYGITSATGRIPRTPEQLAAMERAVVDFMTRYRGKIQAVEFANEFNSQRQMVMSCKDYAIALQSFYKAVKQVAPEVTVVAGGVTRPAADWLAKVMSEGGKGYCDAVSVHTYQEAGTPETKKWDQYCEDVRTALAAVGCGDLPVWSTEANTSSYFGYNTEQQQGMNLVRQFAQCDAYRVQDKYIWYQLQTVETNFNDNESWFGILRGPDVKNANGAKSAYLAASNYFAMTWDATFLDSIQYENVWLLRFQKSDGKRMVMMYCDRDSKSTSLNLGASSGTLYDINGNSEALSSLNGKYTFAITDEPVYFEYADGEQFERCEEQFPLNQNMFELTAGSTCTFELTVPKGAVVTASAREQLDVKVAQNGTKATIAVNANKIPQTAAYTERRQNYGTMLYRDFVSVKVKQDANTIASLPLSIEYVQKQADITMRIQPYDNTNTKYWKGFVEVRNNNIQKTLNGTLVMDSPAALAESVEPIEVKGIQPLRKSTYAFNLPPTLTNGKTQLLSGVLKLDDGDEIPFSLGDLPRSYGFKKNSGTNIKYLKKATEKLPVIDGVIEENEWKNYKVTDFDKSQVSFGSQGVSIAGVVEGNTFGKDADYGGKADFSGSIYANWDNEFLYCAAVVYDDVHFQKDDPRSFYLDDLFYITLCPSKTQRHDTRIDFALTDFFGDQQARFYRNWSEMFDVVVGGVIPQSEDGFQGVIIRKDHVTIYEARMPWNQIVSKEALERKNFNLAFNIRDYDGDRDKTFSYGGWYCLVEQNGQ